MLATWRSQYKDHKEIAFPDSDDTIKNASEAED
jgi:hypothetical protein